MNAKYNYFGHNPCAEIPLGKSELCNIRGPKKVYSKKKKRGWKGLPKKLPQDFWKRVFPPFRYTRSRHLLASILRPPEPPMEAGIKSFVLALKVVLEPLGFDVREGRYNQMNDQIEFTMTHKYPAKITHKITFPEQNARVVDPSLPVTKPECTEEVIHPDHFGSMFAIQRREFRDMDARMRQYYIEAAVRHTLDGFAHYKLRKASG